ncbi:MAG TPA: hypothetical protein VH877_31790 [Polyangia bacterium]|jgi:hypothetical protein|nr:hypothetical protein [Polyangia bacterium]
MPSLPHEIPLALFRNCPELVAQLLRDGLAIELPAYGEVRVEEADFTQLVPTEFRADLVIVLLRDGVPVLGIIVEVQRKIDPRKRFTWPVYWTALRARLGCPVALLVFTDDLQVMDWAREPIPLGLRSVIEVLVVGPKHVPWVRTAEQARQWPELAVLSALSHGNEAEGVEVVLAALEAVVGLDAERRSLYYDVLLGSLNETTRQALEQEMETRKYEYQSEFARNYFAQGEAKGRAEGKAEGKAEGEVDALLAVLGARGMTVDAETHARIVSCVDLGLLKQWIVRAVTASSLAEVFESDL